MTLWGISFNNNVTEHNWIIFLIQFSLVLLTHRSQENHLIQNYKPVGKLLFPNIISNIISLKNVCLKIL